MKHILTYFFLVGLLAACGGGGGGVDEEIVEPPVVTPSPSVSFSSSAASVTLGQTFILTWSTVNADTCVASGDWSGDKALSGSESILASISGVSSYTLSCSGEGGTQTQRVDVEFGAVSGSLDPWYGSKTPWFVSAPPSNYTIFEDSSNLSITGAPEGISHNGTDAPGAGKFIFNRVYRTHKHGLGRGEQFGIYSSWLSSFGVNSIEGGLWVNPGAAGPDYYPTLHLASIGDAYHICNDVQMGSGLYGVFIGDRWLNMVQISNQVLTIPGSNIAFDMNQNPNEDENGIWTGWGWTYLNFDHPRDYKFWMSFVETYDYQGPINGYIPEHFNWVDPAKITNGQFADTLAQYGSNFGTMATKGSNANGGTANEYYVNGTLRMGDDLFYVPTPKFPIKKEREYILAHPQNISQSGIENYASSLKNGSLTNALIPSSNLSFNNIYQSTHQALKILEQVNGEEYRYIITPLYKVGYEGHLGFVDWDFSDATARALQESSNGHAYVRRLQTKWVVEPGASDDYKNHPHQYNAEIVAAPDTIARAPQKNYKFFNYNERDTSHPDFTNWDISGKTRYQTQIQNGALVTYVWFKFIEQPAMLSAAQNHPETYTTTYLNQLQGYVENLHSVANQNSKTNPTDPVFINYRGAEQPDNKDFNLAKIDPGQLVSPLEGFEVGYVPVVISSVHPEALTFTGVDMVTEPASQCTDSAWTDSFYPDNAP